MKKRHSIATRIFLLFGLAGVVASSAVLTNFYSFSQLAGSVETTVEQQLPILISAAKIAHTGGIITTEVSNLAGANSVAKLIHYRANLQGALPLLAELATTGLNDLRRNELVMLVESLEHNIANISANSQEKLRLKEKLAKTRQYLHWLQVDFVDEVVPLAAESQYNLNQLVNNIGFSHRLLASEVAQLSSETNIQAQLLKFEADFNLVLDLLQRVPLFDSRTDVLAAQSIIDENLETIAKQIQVLNSIPSSITLRQMAASVVEHIEGPDNMLERSLRVLILDEQNLTLLQQNRVLIQRVKLIIDQAILDAEQANIRTTQQLTETLAQSQKQLNYALLAIFAITLAVAWYLKRHLLNRLAYVLRSMRHLAEGEQQQMIHVAGKDEVASLADATNIFNYQAQELRRYTDTLVEINKKLVVEVKQRKQTELELRDTQEGLIQAGKLAVLGQLTTGIVHEFSQPLAAIRSNTYLCQQYLSAQKIDKAITKLEKVDAITDRATKLCQHLKSFSRKSNDKYQSINLLQVIDNAIELFTETLPLKWLKVEVEPNLTVIANEVRLEQVFVNLISNSVDAINEHQEQPGEIAIIATERASQVIIDLRDNGCGIEQDKLERIFEPFFSTKEVGKGLGLGMSITHNIIHDFGGTIEVNSHVGQGTEVRLCLNTTSCS